MSELTPRQSSKSNGIKKLSLSAIFVLVFMLFNVMIPTVSAANQMMSGTLEMGDELESPDGNSRFIIQPDGNAVVYQNKTAAKWWSGPLGTGKYYILLTNVGDLCVYNADHKCVKSLARFENPPQGQWDLSLWNNGVLYLKDPSGEIRWINTCYSQVNTVKSDVPFFDHCIPSPNNQQFLKMQTDGHLVIYDGYRAVRAFNGLYGRKNVYLHLSKTGTITLNTIGGLQTVISKNTNGKTDTYHLGVTNDAKLRVSNSKGETFELL
ncbi:MAG: hypothetical protein J3Q66DRAFT_362946 [Benniella sp.]|nr:MAG: hypothetical protein J3Q66DRAFT_362946 [Benniella sp.]